jgi:hypothetical protein
MAFWMPVPVQRHRPRYSTISALEVVRGRAADGATIGARLGGSYKSFWFMAHRIRVALSGEEPDAFRSVLERLLESGHVSYRSVIAPRAVAHAA